MLTLQEWRRAKGVSRAEWAAELGVSPSTVMKWETRGTKVPVQMAIKACDFLGISLSDVNFFAQE